MAKFSSQWYRKIFSNMHHKYRFVIMDENFQEKYAFRLSRLNVYVSVGMGCLILISGTFSLIAFTGLRELIPGYTNHEVQQLAYSQSAKLDTLERQLQSREILLESMRLALSGEIPIENFELVRDSLKQYDQIEDHRSQADEKLRQEIETGQPNSQTNRPQNTLSSPAKNQTVEPKQAPLPKNKDRVAETKKTPETPVPATKKTDKPAAPPKNKPAPTPTKGKQITFKHQSPGTASLLYIPVQGTMIRDYDPDQNHFGIDITGRKDDVIKAVQNGTVVRAEWSTESGYIIVIQHDNNLQSCYKNTAALLKRVGDYVYGGDPIAFIGNQGEGFKGPLLHFELWLNGSPVNPRNYVPL